MAAKRSSKRKSKVARKRAKQSAGSRRVAGKARSVARKTAARKPTRPARNPQLEANKKLVLAFYEQIIGRKDFDAALPYMGATYRQHAPYAADGHEGLRAWLAGFKAAFPNHRYEVKRVIAEGPYVMLHLHGMGGPNPHGEAVIDIFRVENGKVVEHWDIIQAIPDSADNANSMF
jgi:predicted SnoaL-like aldol condensation-catalyzing enzyme